MSKWYETSIFYHIYPLGLAGAEKTNTVRAQGQQAQDGPQPRHRLRELMPWLDHIRDLGCGGLYIGPLFESSSHGYDTIDYKSIDSRLGDREDFKAFVSRAHELGIRVVVDAVFNHTGREFFAFEDIRANRENSPYRWWYKGINFGWNSAWNDGFGYESWRGCGDLVNLDLRNHDVREYLFDVVRYWIHEFEIDGLRLDCADCLDFDFMRDLRRVTEYEKQDFYLLGEVIHGDYARWANNEMLHAVTNYDLHKGLYSGHNDHNYFEIAHTIRRQFDENGGIYRGRTLYSFVDNHDVTRLVDKVNDPGHVKLIYTLAWTLPGVPSVYYGSEWGIHGRKEEGDWALRPAIDLGQIQQNPPMPGLCEYITMLGRLRNEHPSLQTGRYRELLLTNRQYAFARIGSEEAAIVICNNDEKPAEVWVRLPFGENPVTDAVTKETKSLDYAQLHLTLEADSAAVFIQQA